jgi:DedD protein
MGLLSIFQRTKTAADSPAPAGRGTKARPAARQAPAANVGAPADAAEAVREARARARRRLMGATVLLLVGVIGAPLLFESQPRPIPVDLPIEIPQRNATGPLDAAAMPAPANRGTQAATPAPATASSSESVSYDAKPSAPPSPAAARATAAVPAPKPAAPVAAASKPAAPAPHVAQADAPPAPSASSTAAAAALLGAPEAAAGTNRYIVQVAAFKPSDDAKIRDIRGKVEKLGLKTYTQPVDTPGGKWIRVRVGPYATKTEADSAVAKIASAGLGLQPKVYLP